jgi:ParB-like chromosome segregation protein Spo0J
MAVQWESDTMQRAGELWSEYPEVIHVEPDLNGRHENTDIDSLIADIEVNNQHTPCGFRKGEKGETILVYGHRRYRAVLAINKKRAAKAEPPIKLLGTYLRLDDKGAFLRAISENRERKDVSPIDDAHNIGTLIERFQYSLEEIAKIYFPDIKSKEEIAEALHFVKQRHALLELAPEAAKAVREKRIKMTAAVELSKLSREAQRSLVNSQPTGRIKVKAVKKANPKKNGKEAKAVDREAVLPLVKKLLKGVEEKQLNNDEYEWIEVKREVLLSLHNIINN